MESTRDTRCGRMSPERSVQTEEMTSESSCKSSAKSKTIQPLFLNLRKGGGDGEQRDSSWEMGIPSLGESSMRNFGESPNAVEESSLLQILEAKAQDKYSLSEKACRGILRRSAARGKELPEILLSTLIEQGRVTDAELEEMGIKPRQ